MTDSGSNSSANSSQDQKKILNDIQKIYPLRPPYHQNHLQVIIMRFLMLTPVII